MSNPCSCQVIKGGALPEQPWPIPALAKPLGLLKHEVRGKRGKEGGNFRLRGFILLNHEARRCSREGEGKKLPWGGSQSKGLPSNGGGEEKDQGPIGSLAKKSWMKIWSNHHLCQIIKGETLPKQPCPILVLAKPLKRVLAWIALSNPSPCQTIRGGVWPG